MKDNFPRSKNSSKLRRKMTEMAREFRKEPTRSEAILWQALRGKKLDGIKFRRQQPVGSFVVDLYNSVYRLVIEIDGTIHDSQFEADKNRQNILEELGLNILRINAELVEKDVSSALEIIHMKIKDLQFQSHESPSPILGEGQGGG